MICDVTDRLKAAGSFLTGGSVGRYLIPTQTGAALSGKDTGSWEPNLTTADLAVQSV